MKRFFTFLLLASLSNSLASQSAIYYDPIYDWQFKINNYQQKEFELFFQIISDEPHQKYAIPIYISCSEGVFNVPDNKKNILKTQYGLKYINKSFQEVSIRRPSRCF